MFHLKVENAWIDLLGLRAQVNLNSWSVYLFVISFQLSSRLALLSCHSLAIGVWIRDCVRKVDHPRAHMPQKL